MGKLQKKEIYIKKESVEKENLLKKIKLFSNKIWKPVNLCTTPVNTHSWFKMNIGNNNLKKDYTTYKFNTQKLNKAEYKCKKIYLNLTEKQRKIILIWMDAYIKMYNETLHILRKKEYNKEIFKTNFREVRDEYVLQIKNDIIKKLTPNEEDDESKKNDEDKPGIYAHVLDSAIHDVCTAYKSGASNVKNGYIKHFRVRYIKLSKKQKIIKIESNAISTNGKSFCSSFLGKKIKIYPNEYKIVDFSDIKHEMVLQYKQNKFALFIPEKVESTQTEVDKPIGIDPGIRTPYTGYTQGHTLDIGGNFKEKITPIINQIQKIKKSKKSKQRINRGVNKRYAKIENMVDDMQWKTIKYLTDNYSTILMGNMSTKNIVHKGSNISKSTKRSAMHVKLYEFKMRLKYKCAIKGVKYGEIKENYTSKMCTICRNIKEDLGGNEVYECDKCGVKMERDVNGARNIYMVTMRK